MRLAGCVVTLLANRESISVVMRRIVLPRFCPPYTGRGVAQSRVERTLQANLQTAPLVPLVWADVIV
jgi:hypothetical protein